MIAKIGIYPGTFDPITKGHVDIITRAMKMVDKLIVAVALDTIKKPSFNLDLREEMTRNEIANLNLEDKIEVKKFSGLLVNFARDNNASVIFRGLRALSDFEYEFQMACMNTKLAPDIETAFLTASESTHFISSRFVKQVAQLGGDIDGFVSKDVKEKLSKYFADEK